MPAPAAGAVVAAPALPAGPAAIVLPDLLQTHLDFVKSSHDFCACMNLLAQAEQVSVPAATVLYRCCLSAAHASRRDCPLAFRLPTVTHGFLATPLQGL